MESTLREHWGLDPAVTFLNHGSFGACPTAVRGAQRALQDRLERQPVDFFARDWWGLVEEARQAVAAFVGADPAGFVFVRNATEGVNAVLRSFPLQAGDEVLVTDHEYQACRNAVDFVCARAGARVMEVALPFVGYTAAEVEARILAAVTPRTRLALVDHVTSQTGLVLPVERLVPALAERGVPTLVDGAHAPGMVALDLDALGAAFYTANCHKWLCAPKGAGFLWVGAAHRAQVRPLSISHGAAMAPPPGGSRLHAEFDWPGTADFTAWLCVPRAIEFVGGLLPGGWPAIRARNHALAVQGRARVCAALGVAPPCDAAFIGCMASIPLPDAGPTDEGRLARDPDPLNQALRARGVEVPVVGWPHAPHRVLRISAALYNTAADYDRLAQALEAELC